MPNRYPFAVRLIGFADDEASSISATFAGEHRRSYGYFRLLDDNLQDPDLYLANADELKALVALSYLHPTELRPALLVGLPSIDVPYLCLRRPIQWHKLFDALDTLVEKRADALSRLEASDVVAVPERRRRDRLDLDLTDPSEYRSMRRESANGGVLIIDKSAALRDYLAAILARNNMPVEWVGDETAAIKFCAQQKVSVVLINTSAPGIDPYRLCQHIKRNNAVQKTSVIFLTGNRFTYDAARARCAGSDGFLNKPLAAHHLLSALKKFLPESARI